MRKPPLDPSLFTFSPTAGTVTFAAGSTRPTHQAQIVSIVNTSNEIYLYLPVQSGRGGAYNATTGILTLEIVTTAMSSGDALQIVIDDSEIGATSALQAAGNVLLGGIGDKLPPLDGGRWPVSGPLTDVELRAQPVPVSGTFWPATQPVSGTFWQTIQPVSGPLTNVQLTERLPILTLSGTRLQVEPSLATDASTATNQAASNVALGSIDGRLGVTGTGAPTLPTGASGLAGLVQVLYQAVMDRLPAALSSGRLLVAPSLATDAATATNQETINNRLGTTNETPPNSDTASAGLNGRMQRLAQRLSSILLTLPAFGTAGTPSADVLTVQGVSSGTPLRIASGVLGEFAYNSGTNIIAGNTQLMLIDCSNCSAVSIHVTSFATGGGIVAEWSNNGINFGTPQTLQQSNTNTQWGTTINGVGTYIASRMGKWLQLRQSIASTGGSNTSIVVTQLSDSPAVSAIVQLVGGSTNIIGGAVQSYSAATAFAAATKYSVFSVAGTNAAVVKNSPGKVYGFWFTNTTANFVAIRLYNLTVAPTVGTSTTFTRIVVPPNDCVSYNQEGGYLHSVGIAIAITAGLSDSDNTAVAVGAVIGELFTI